MIPILYDKKGTEKLAILNDCIECYVEEERNGPLELTMVYPNDESALHLLQENIIVADVNDTLKNQQFRIYEVVKLMSNELEVTARHISFDLAFDVIDTITIENQSCEYALNTIFRNSQFCRHYVGHSDIINAQDYSMQRCTCQEAIYGKKGSIIDTYGTGAEILRDNTDIHVLNKRGHDNGVTIEYSKNLTGFELEEDASELVTRIIPYAKFKEAEAAEETTLWVLEGVDSPLISNYSHPYVQYIDYSSSFEQDETPTEAKLIEKALNEFSVNNKDKPKQNFKIEFIPLSKCVGFEGLEDAISLCDTVTIKDSRFNLDTKAKVIKTTYDVLRDRYESMELGEPRTSLGDIIGNQDVTTGPPGPAGPQGPAGADGSIDDFPDSLPAVPELTAKVLGFASIELSWTYENQAYYNYEIYGSTTQGFTPNTFDLIHAGQTSSFLFQAQPGQTWYFRACAVNSYGRRTAFSRELEVVTTKVDDLENYFTSAAIGQAVIGTLSADYMEAGIIKGHWIDAKNLSVTDGNGNRTLDIDSYGNVTLNVTSLKILSSDVVTEDKIVDTLVTTTTQYYLSTSLTILEGGSWQETAPPWTSGKYMWQRMKYTYRDGSVGYSTAVCIAGAQGEKGEDGKDGEDGTSITVKGTYSSYEELIRNHPTGNTPGDAYIIDKNLFVWDGTQFVDAGQFKGDDGEKGEPGEKGQSLVSSTPQWYLSNSKTTQTGGSWVESMPALVQSKYLWLRYKLVWENPSAVTYTTPTLEQIAESVKEVIEKQATFEYDMDGFRSSVSATYATKAQVSTVSTTASNALTTANNATETANQANNTANQANSTANSANANATNALNKANSNAVTISTLTTKQSSLEQTVSGFKQEVSASYATKEEVLSATEVGLNLIYNGTFAGASPNMTASDIPSWHMWGAIKVYQNYAYWQRDGSIALQLSYGSAGGISQHLDGQRLLFKNATYTLSFHCGWEANVYNPICGIEYYNGSTKVQGDVHTCKDGDNVITFTTPDITYTRVTITFNSDGLTQNTGSYILMLLNKVKLERGSVATGWIENSHFIGHNYTTKTEFNQSSEDFQFKIKQSGGGNLLKNTKFRNGTTHWNLWNWEGTNISSKSMYAEAPWETWNYNKDAALRIDVNVKNGGGYIRTGFSSHRVAVKPNTKYTFSCYVDAHRATGVCFEIYSAYNGGWSYDQGIGAVASKHHGSNKPNYQDWVRHEYTFTTRSNVTEIDIRGYMSEHNGNDQLHAVMWIGLPCLVEGSVAMEWIPHESEVYDGIVTIGSEGVVVTHTGSSTYTKMDNVGFTATHSNGCQTTMNSNGLRTTHSDGSYTQIGPSGLQRYVSGTGKNYHYLQYMGELIIDSEAQVKITLPAEFKGKNFQVVTSVKRIYVALLDYIEYARFPLLSFYAEARNINTSAGTFEIYGSVRAWNRTGVSGFGTVVGTNDTAAETAALKPVVAYWVYA